MQGHVDLDSSREELSGCSLEFALGRVGEGRLLEATGDRSPREMASGRASFTTFAVEMVRGYRIRLIWYLSFYPILSPERKMLANNFCMSVLLCSCWCFLAILERGLAAVHCTHIFVS